MTEQSTATYTVRRCNLSDAPFVIRAQAASKYELESLDDAEIEFGLATGDLEAYVLIGSDVRMCVVVQREGYKALLAGWYREGGISPSALKEQSSLLWEKVVDELQRGGITEVSCFVHRKNPKRDQLMRFYHRMFGLDWDMVRASRSI